MRDRLTSIQDEHETNVAQRQARHSYVLSVAAALFLPLSFIIGLFSVNLAAIIGADHPQAFAILCLSMLGLSMLGLSIMMIALLRWVRWV